MNTLRAYVVYLIMIGCYSSTINRNRRQLESDYETTTLPSDDTEDDIYFIEEMTTIANLEVYDLEQRAEQQNDTDVDPQDLLLESIILSFMEIDDSLEEATQSSSTVQSDISEPLDTSFFSQREQLRQQMKNSDDDGEKVQGKNILFDDWSDPSYVESNIQKINQKKRNVSKKDFEEFKDHTRRYASKFLDELTQNMDILKNKQESIYYANRYADKFLDEPINKMETSEKYKNSKDILEKYQKNLFEEPFVITNFPTKPQNIATISVEKIAEPFIDKIDFMEKPKHTDVVTKMYSDDSILKAAKIQIDNFKKPELLKEYKNIQIEKTSEEPTESEDLVDVHKKTRQVIETDPNKNSQKSADTVDTLNENQKELMEFTKINTDSASERPSMPIDILENPEESKEKIHTKRVPEIPFTECKDLSDIHEKSLERAGGFIDRVFKKPNDMIDIASMRQESKKLTSRYAQRFFKNHRELDVLTNHETKNQKLEENIPEEFKMPLGTLKNLKDDTEITKLHVMRVPEKPFEHILDKQEPERELKEVTEKFHEKPIKLSEVLSKDTKSTAFTKVNAEIVLDKGNYGDDEPEKQRELREPTRLYADTSLEKPTWRIDILRNPENPQEFKKIFTEKGSGRYAEIIDNLDQREQLKEFSRTHTGSIADKLAVPIDFLEKHEELQEFKKIPAKRDPEKLIDAIDILNKQEKLQRMTGIYSETVSPKPNDSIDILNEREESRLPSKINDEITPEKITHTMHATEKQRESKEFKKIYPESMIDNPAMLMEILEKYRNPQAFTRVYSKEHSDRPTEKMDILMKHNGETNEFRRPYTENTSGKFTTRTDDFGNKEENDSSGLHAMKILKNPSEVIDVLNVNEMSRAHTKINTEIIPNKSSYATHDTEKAIKFNERSRIYSENANDKPTWQTDLLHKHENSQAFTAGYTKEIRDGPLERIDVAVKHNSDPKEYRRTYTKSISDKVTIPDGLDNNESREFTRMHAIRVLEKPSE